MVLPQIAGTGVQVAVLGLPAMRVAGNRDAALAVDLLNDALDAAIRVNEPFDINCQDVIPPGLVGHFSPGDHNHAVLFPGPGGLVPDLFEIPVEFMRGDGASLRKALPKLRIRSVIGDANRIKTAGTIQVHHGFRQLGTIAPLGVNMKITQQPSG